MLKKSVFASFILAALALPFAVSAENYWWNPDAAATDISDTTSGNWKTGTNPSNTLTPSDSQPGSADNAYLVGANGATSVLSLGSGNALAVTDFGVAYGWNNTVTFTNAGTITATGTTTLGYWGGVGSITQTGGTWTNHKLIMGGDADRQKTIAELNLLGGSFIINNNNDSGGTAASIGDSGFSNWGSRLTINIAGGDFIANEQGTKFVQVGNVGGSTGTVNQTSGTATIGGLNIGNKSAGFYNISGGTLTLTTNSGYDHNIGAEANGYGELNVSGNGAVVADKMLVVGKKGEGHLNVSDEATVTINGGFAMSSAGGTGSIHMTGGTMNVNVQQLGLGTTASVVDVNVEGGTLNIGSKADGYLDFGAKTSSTNTLTVSGTGAVNVNNTHYGIQLRGKTTINLDGGTHAALKIEESGSGDDLTQNDLALNFNGGVLVSDGTGNLFGNDTGRLALNVCRGGAIIDVDNNRTINQKFSSAVGADETDGGFTKRGAGTVYIIQMPEWNGVTRVEEGQFQFGPGGGGGIGGSTLTTPIAVTEAAKWYAVTKDTHDLTAIGTWTNSFKITDYTQNSRKTLDRFCVEGGSVKLDDGTFEATNLVLTTGAVLDLNGGTMTIKNLYGEGVVTNGTVVFIGGGEIKPTGAIKLPGGATLSGTLYATIDENGALAGSIAFDGAIMLDGLNLVVDGEENFDKTQKVYTLVRGSSVSGSLGTVTGITAGGRWSAQVRGTSVAISYSAGFALFVR